jgi:hypothetical protein
VAATTTPKRHLTFVAPKPTLSGEAGERIGQCIGTKINQYRDKTQVVLLFDFGEQIGRMWVQVQKDFLSGTRYMHLVRLALGGDPPAGTPIDPQTVFLGKWFRCFVGWRTDPGKPRSSFEGSKAPWIDKKGKEHPDFMRVRELLELLDEAEGAMAIGHRPWP